MWDVISPILANTLAVVLTALIGWAATALQKKFNIEIEASYRESLHRAIMSGVNAALSRVGGLVEPLPPQTKTEVVDQAIAYARKSVPDAIESLKATPEVLGAMASAKLNIIATEQSKAPVPLATAQDSMRNP